jgi:PIN domain nuclease of toxin-antitoxin system
VLNDPQLSAAARVEIADPANEVEVSPTSYWELAIKIRLGKYSLSEPLDVFMERELAVTSSVCYRLSRATSRL